MASQIFKDDVVCLSGTFPGYKHNDLKDLVKDHGGTFATRVVPTCTHLVTTLEDVDAGSAKQKQALGLPNVKLVNLQWLLDSTGNKKRLDETPYLFSSSSAAPPPAAAPAPAPAAPASPPPKARPTRAKRALPSQTNGTADAASDDEPLAKKTKGNAKKAPGKNGAVAVKKQDSPAPTQSKLKVPVDCPNHASSGWQIHIKDGVIYDAALNQTNASNNNNKFYIIQLLEKGSTMKTWTRWGRVGEYGATATLPGTYQAFEKKFKDKSGLSWENRLSAPRAGKYTYIERNYEDDDEEEDKPKKEKKVKNEDDEDVEEIERKPAECTLAEPVRDVVSLIFNTHHFQTTMADMEYDANKLPLGKLSKRTLQMGFQLLKDLAELVSNPGLADSKYSTTQGRALEQLSNQYFTVIPHSFGRRRPPIIHDQVLIKREVDLLDALTDMEIANEIMNVSKSSKAAYDVHPLDQQYMGLKLREMMPLEHASAEFQHLEEYLMKSHGSTHHFKYKLRNIFRIERDGEHDRFLESPYAKLKNSNRRLLWHGSRTTNYGGILSQGLRIAPPEAPVSGYMFGKGVYFADMSSKSAGYCASYNSNNMGLLMLCDVELGDPMLELTNAEYNAGQHAKKQGKLATLGKGRTVPAAWKDAGCVHPDLRGVLMPDTTSPPKNSDDAGVYLQYNEYIVYDVAQIRIRYLLLVQMK